MKSFSRTYGDLVQTNAKYNVKPREDLLNLLDIRPATILELGCADGTNLLFFRDRLALQGIKVERLVGVDAQAIDDCPHYANFEFVHSTAETFVDQCREKFDLIILSDVVEHLYNPWATLSLLSGHLEENGRVLISVPNLQNIRYISGVASGKFYYEDSGLMDVTHIRFFSRETLAALLQECGYEVLRSGFRPDAVLSSDVEQWRRHLAHEQALTVTFGVCSLVVSRQNLDLLSAQQVLVSARKIKRGPIEP